MQKIFLKDFSFANTYQDQEMATTKAINYFCNRKVPKQTSKTIENCCFDQRHKKLA